MALAGTGQIGVNSGHIGIGAGQGGIKKRDLTTVSLCLLFALSLIGAAYAGQAYGTGTPVIELTPERLQRFTAFYRDNFFSELGIIFANNSAAALLLIYFTPMALRLHKWLGFLRPPGCRLTRVDRFMLSGFPAFFIIKQGAVMGLSLAGFASRIGESPAATFFSIIFPHLSLEALAICLAGAQGLKETGQCLAGGRASPGTGMSALLIIGLMALAALLEVALTPRVFAFVMSN